MQILFLTICGLLLSQDDFHDILRVGRCLNMLTLVRIFKMIHISSSSYILLMGLYLIFVDSIGFYKLDALLFEHWRAISVEKR